MLVIMASKQQTLDFFNFKRKQSETREKSGENEEESGNQCGPSSSNESNSKKRKVFQSSWLNQFDWLRSDTEKGTMHCVICETYNGGSSTPSMSGSAFIKGSKNFQRSALVRHQDSDDHKIACSSKRQKVYMDTARKIITNKYQPILEAQLKTALWLASENVPNRKFSNLVDLQIANAPAFTGASPADDSSSGKGIYKYNMVAADMQKCLADALTEMMLVRIRNSPFIGIMVDESLDIATTKKLVMFCKIIHNGEMKIEFVANIDIQNGKAETIYNMITEWLVSVGINIKKVSGFGSDGAAVMTGSKNGVGVRLQRVNPKLIHIWCAAHRVALVSFWAAKKIPYLQKVQETLIAIYNFYEYSAPRYNKIKDLTKLMGEKVLKFKKPTQVRWLSLEDAIKSVYSAWSALVLGLEHEIATEPLSVGANKARFILKEVKCFKFISTVCLLHDILNSLGKLSKCFQRDNIDIHVATGMIDVTKDFMVSLSTQEFEPSTVSDLIDVVEETGQFHGIPLTCSLRDRLNLVQLRRKFASNILEQFEVRFPANDMKILKDINILLNPALLPISREGITAHGNTELENVLAFYGEDIIDPVEARNSFLQFKFLVNSNRNLNLQEICKTVIKDYHDTFPSFKTMAEIILTIPLTSVPCERGFSLQNRHIGRFTSRRNVENVQNRMMIDWASHQDGFDQQEVIRSASQMWNNVHVV